MSTAKYVPPSQRAGYVASASSAPPPSVFTARRDLAQKLHSRASVAAHFGHVQRSTLSFFSNDFHHSAAESEPTEFKYVPPSERRQPTDLIESRPKKEHVPSHPLEYLVSFIFVFRNAHPRWQADNELWTHTNARLMLDDWEGPRKNFGRPIPAFFTARSKDTFVFGGWWVIDSLTKVDCQSAELKEMLEEKESRKGYSRSGRTSEAWQASLDEDWIRLKLSPVAKSSEQYGELKDPMEMPGGKALERSMLELGGLQEELELLNQEAPAKTTTDEEPVDTV